MFTSNEFYKTYIGQHNINVDYEDIDIRFLSYPGFHFNTMNFMYDF